MEVLTFMTEMETYTRTLFLDIIREDFTPHTLLNPTSGDAVDDDGNVVWDY